MLVEVYEVKYFLIELLDFIDVICFCMEQGGLIVKDLVLFIGQFNCVYEVLNCKCGLILEMIWKFYCNLGIFVESFIGC